MWLIMLLRVHRADIANVFSRKYESTYNSAPTVQAQIPRITQASVFKISYALKRTQNVRLKPQI